MSIFIVTSFFIIYYYIYSLSSLGTPAWIIQPDLSFYLNFYSSKFFGSRLVGILHIFMFLYLIMFYFKKSLKKKYIIFLLIFVFYSYFLPMVYGYLFEPIILARYLIFVLIPIFLIISHIVFDLESFKKNILILIIIIMTIGNFVTEETFKQFYKQRSVYKPELSSKKLKKLRLIDLKSGKNHNSLNKYYNSDKRLSSNFGNIFHNIMSEIEYKHQSDYVINDYFNRGFINKKEKNQIKNSADLIMNHSCLQRFFSKKNIVYNEREVFIPPDKVIIPDKTVFTSKKDVFILDYKTGKRIKAHQNQIKSYADALKNANYRVKGAFLVYVSAKIDVLEISI